MKRIVRLARISGASWGLRLKTRGSVWHLKEALSQRRVVYVNSISAVLGVFHRH